MSVLLRRRDVIAVLGGAAAAGALPRAVRAQQPGKVWRVGILDTTSVALNRVNFDALLRGLRELGYVEGQNLAIEYRSSDGHAERFGALAAELVRLRVDVIVTRGTPAALAAKDASNTIPVVMAASGEPLATGVVAGLARPGGNVTGFSALTGDLEPKRVEMLREIVPQAKRIALLYNMSNPVVLKRWEIIQTLLRSLRVEPELLDVRTADDFERAFEQASRKGADALVVGNDGLIQANRPAVIELAARHRLPAVYGDRQFVDSGGLLSYSVNYAYLYFRVATVVDKIFKGTKPADLPVEQAAKFELVVNLKTAKALGLTVPETFLLRADAVIE